MTMTELFAAGYRDKADGDTLARFTKRCRVYGDRMGYYMLVQNGVSVAELKAERESGLIKYEPDCGITRRDIGYSLTAAGIAKVYRMIKADVAGREALISQCEACAGRVAAEDVADRYCPHCGRRLDKES